MISIKVTKNTKEKIEQTRAEIMLKHHKKVGQVELVEKMINMIIDDPKLRSRLMQDETEITNAPKRQQLVEVEITKRSKGRIRLFQDEWEE